MTVADIMSPNPVIVTPAMPIAEARDVMHKNHIHHLIVARGVHPVGVVSARDLIRADLKNKPKDVADVMTRRVVTIDARQALERAAYRLRGHTIGCLVVLKRGDIAGIITTSDLLGRLAAPRYRRPRAHAGTAIHHRVVHRHRSRPDGVW